MNELRMSNELLEHIQELEREKEELEEQVKQLLDDKHDYQERIDAYREREERKRRLLANKNISAAHKLILLHIEDEASQQRPELTDQIRIDMSAVGQATGLSRYTVGDKVRDLATWGAIVKTTEAVKMEKKGKKFEVDLVSVALKPSTLIAPEDIQPIKENGEEYSRNHGGRRERCRRCKSENIQRVHHIRCLDCGDEYICGDEQVQDALQFEASVSQVASRIIEADTIHESTCHSELAPSMSQLATRRPSSGTSVSQVASRIIEAQTTSGSSAIRESSCPMDRQPSVSQVAPRIVEAHTASPSFSPSPSAPAPLEEALSEAGADFWTRWRALSGESHLNETACKHIEELAHDITSTQDLQSLYDIAYNRLEELAKAQNKKAVPPRLGNLVKCLPEWKQTQRRRDQEREKEQAPEEHVIPGTGRLTNWTQQRLKGETVPPVVYKRLEPSARSQPTATKGNGLSKITFSDMHIPRGKRE